MYKKIFAALKNYFGIIIIGTAFAVSALAVFLNSRIDEDVFYIVKTGDTLKSIADEYSITIDQICNENYPDVSEKFPPAAGSRIKIPKNARAQVITVRLAHWQLEPGVRDGIDYMAKEYQKLHPNARIVQNPVPEATYGQWFITQMLGGTAPDLIQVGFVPYNLLIGYYFRYFTPLTPYVTSPNPYNKHNEFKDIALRDTVKDGYKNLYNADVQEYMTIGLSQHLVRFYYNRSLLEKLTGRTNAPRNLSEFMKVCSEIKQHKYVTKAQKQEIDMLDARVKALEQRISRGEARASEDLAAVQAKREKIRSEMTSYIPIASSRYHIGSVEGNMFNVVTTSARDLIDFNHDCTVSAVEQFVGFKTKTIDLNYPAYRAKFEIVARYCSNSMPGFTGLQRDDGVLMFVQQRAVFMNTGTWDANMVSLQAKDNGFEVGIMDFPYPDPSEPELYKQFYGPAFEDPQTVFQFGTPTPESAGERKRIAIDFLLFMASKENNIRLNEIIGWIPAVKNAEGTGILKYFKPHADGVTPGLNFGIGGESIIKWQQVYAMYQVGQMSFEEMRDEFTPYYIARGYKDYMQVNKNWRRSIMQDEKISSVFKVKAMLATDEKKREEHWEKYRYVKLRPMNSVINTSYDRALLKGAEDGTLKMKAAYEYSPEALARIKHRR
ncbi:MAG: extracellular solute-binding protein [Spirochaetes bacterium]|nr:extracellular solute-binding protein [Spirochaetota bacterium]